MTFVLKLAPDLVTTAPSVRTQVDCLYEVPDVGRHGALVQVSEPFAGGRIMHLCDVGCYIPQKHPLPPCHLDVRAAPKGT